MPVTIIRRDGSVEVSVPIAVWSAAKPSRRKKDANPYKWGPIIKELRGQSGLSQRQLSAITGVDRAIIRRIENGISPGNMDVMETIALSLGYEFELLMLPPLAVA